VEEMLGRFHRSWIAAASAVAADATASWATATMPRSVTVRLTASPSRTASMCARTCAARASASAGDAADRVGNRGGPAADDRGDRRFGECRLDRRACQLGFQMIGTMKSAGIKFGRWLDVVTIAAPLARAT